MISAVYAETLKQEFQKQNFQLSFDFSDKMTKLSLNKEQKEILEQVFNDFGHMNATQLSESTHNESPWKDAYDPKIKLFSTCVITPRCFIQFF